MEKDSRANLYSPETRARAVRMVLDNQGNYESQSAAIKAIAPKIGCGRDTLRRWVQQEEADTGCRDGVTSEERARIKDLERKVPELRQANEILKKASAYYRFGQDVRPKRSRQKCRRAETADFSGQRRRK